MSWISISKGTTTRTTRHCTAADEARLRRRAWTKKQITREAVAEQIKKERTAAQIEGAKRGAEKRAENRLKKRMSLDSGRQQSDSYHEDIHPEKI
jgi:hypothetical protein